MKQNPCTGTGDGGLSGSNILLREPSCCSVWISDWPALTVHLPIRPFASGSLPGRGTSEVLSFAASSNDDR